MFTVIAMNMKMVMVLGIGAMAHGLSPFCLIIKLNECFERILLLMQIDRNFFTALLSRD
jgi:hypothetical protein